MPLYLAFRGRWPDLAYGISGVWALGPKLKFHMIISVSRLKIKFLPTLFKHPAAFLSLRNKAHTSKHGIPILVLLASSLHLNFNNKIAGCFPMCIVLS
jgi:hypothetical protein